jgi:phosphonate transport system substrate-binding protein
MMKKESGKMAGINTQPSKRRSRMRQRFLILIGLVMPVMLSAQTLVVGIVPQQSPLKLIKVWQPVAEHIEKETGHKIVLKIETSIPAFEKQLYAGRYDLAYMNPYHYVVANQKQGYKAVVRADKQIVGILVARKGSEIDIGDLKGKTFLFPAPFAFAATLLAKYELLEDHSQDIENEATIRYVNSHDSVYKGVARGVGDIGGGIERTYNNLGDVQSKSKLQIIHKTSPYPSHPVALKPSLSAEDADALRRSFMSMPEALLENLSMKRIILTDDAEYDSVRNLAKKLKIGVE